MTLSIIRSTESSIFIRVYMKLMEITLAGIAWNVHWLFKTASSSDLIFAINISKSRSKAVSSMARVWTHSYNAHFWIELINRLRDITFILISFILAKIKLLIFALAFSFHYVYSSARTYNKIRLYISAIYCLVVLLAVLPQKGRMNLMLVRTL